MSSESYDLTTARTLDALRVAVNRDHRSRRRRRRTATLAVAVLALTGTAIAGTRTWWTDAPPPDDRAVVDVQLAPTRYPDGHTELLADPKKARTVARTIGASLVAAPSARGSGYCLLPQLPREPGESAVGASLGFGCVPDGSAFGTFTGLSDGEAVWFVYGRIDDDRAAHVDLSEAAGRPMSIDLGPAGFFIAPLPRELWARLDDRRDEVAVVAADGTLLRRVCVPFSGAPYSRVDGPRGGGGLARAEAGEACASEGPAVQAPPVRVSPSPAPPLVGSDISSGRRVALGDLTGMPVIVRFWDSLCTNEEAVQHGCRDATNWELHALRRAYPGIGVISVAVRDELSPAEKASLPDAYPHVLDPDGRLATAYDVTALPALAVLDAEHRVLVRITGVPSERELMAAVWMVAPEQRP